MMKMRVVAGLYLLSLPLMSLGDDSGQRYNRLVDEILEVTGALKIGEQMSAVVVSQMVQALKSSNTEVPDRAYELLEDEVQLTIRSAMESGSFNELMYPVYAKYLDEADLEAMLQFYSTKEGKKIAELMPLMAADGAAVGQRWGAELGPEIANRVLKRLADEGIELQ
jgi:uncharacterized protein